MSKIDELLQVFRNALQEPWTGMLSGAERTWFLVYDPADHRRLMLRLEEFELAARQSGRKWLPVHLRHVFPQWMAEHEYREPYFEDPESLLDQLESNFLDYARATLQAAVMAASPTPDSFVVLHDASALFGLTRLAEVLPAIADATPGRLLVLFPGEFAQAQYRLLGARDGWNYLARPLTAL